MRSKTIAIVNGYGFELDVSSQTTQHVSCPPASLMCEWVSRWHTDRESLDVCMNR